MKKFKRFTLLASRERGKIEFVTKEMRSVALTPKVVHPPDWATDEDGWVRGGFWPSDAGEWWLHHQMKEFADDLDMDDADIYHPLWDDLRDYRF